MLRDKLLTLPMQPGCYLMKDKNGTVIYVGKAKKLKNRVNSYFHGTHNNKTTKLVENIVDFDYIVAGSEKEALILEYNLIKKYKPRFNIIFMDDCSYPYIRLTKEQYPTLKLVRDSKKMKNAIYFGPYPNVGYARELLNLLEKLYPLRKCKNIPSKVCLYYHIGLCLGPCEYKIEKNQYDEITNGIISFMKGNTKEIKEQIIRQRDEFSYNLMFEKAQEKQTLLEAIDHITSKDFMQYNNYKTSMDVFDYYIDNGYISIAGLLYREGKLLYKHSIIKPLYDDVEDEFISYLLQYYNKNPLPKNLVINKNYDIEVLKDVLDTEIIQPQKGDKVKLVDLAIENAKIVLNQKFSIIEKQDNKTDLAMEQLSEILGIDASRIELYDISHISGSNAVASQVVYIDGKPSKKDYRLYKVSNENNDFANMQEVLYRRLYRSITDSNYPLADIIIVDGGYPQIRAAKEILDELKINSVRLLGLAKNDKHQTANLIDDQENVIDIDKESDLFYLLTMMQDEVHRSAISFHQRLRNKEMSKSQLDEINGIGEKRKSLLLKKFGSVNKIKQASIEQLNEVISIDSAKNVYEYFHKKDEKENEIDLDFLL